MKTLAPKLIPMAVASMICSLAMAGGDKAGHHSMQMMDKDGDGKVTAVEHDAAAKLMFTKMDTNADGRVTAAEMDAAQPMMAESDKDAMKSRDEARQGQDTRATDTSRTKGKMSSSARIAAIDSNSDGQLTAEEHAAGSKKKFQKMDKDGDGALTAQEMRTGHGEMRTAHDE